MSVLKETPEEAKEFAAMQDDEPHDSAPPSQPPPVASPGPPPASGRTAEAPPPQELPPVPSYRLREEREHREKLEREVAELRSRMAAPPPPPRAPEPDVTTDPIGTIERLRQRVAEAEERDRLRLEQEARQRQEWERQQELVNKIQARTDAYAAEHPEFNEQVQFWRTARARSWQRLGYNQQQILQMIQADELALGQRALDQDLDPGTLVAQEAQDRGWRLSASGLKANGGSPPIPDQEPRARVTPSAAEERMATVERGQRAARSPSVSGGGGDSPDEMTLERLASLDGPAFDAAFKKYGRKLIG